jgi:hypothetical protein
VPSVTVTDSGNLLLAAPGRDVQMQVRYECCVGRKSVLVLSACIDAHTHTHIHTRTHTHTHTHTITNTNTNTRAHTHTHTHTQTQAHVVVRYLTDGVVC